MPTNTLRNAEVIESMGMLRGYAPQVAEQAARFFDLQALASERAGGFQAVSPSCCRPR